MCLLMLALGTTPAWSAAITVLPLTLSTPQIGTAYSVSLSANGGTPPYRFDLVNGGLPAGLSLSSNGYLTGTPTAGGTFSMGISATDSTAPAPLSQIRTYIFTISPPSLLPTNSAPNGVVSTPYSYQFTTSGGTTPYEYEHLSGNIPPGLSVTKEGLLQGTPTAAGDYTFKVQSKDSTTGQGPYAVAFDVSLKIDATGAAPVAGAVSKVVSANTSANPVSLNISGGAATAVAVPVGPGQGTVSIIGTTISYSPTPGYSGLDSFTYTASNAFGTSSPATVAITVNAVVPDAPTIGTATASDGLATVTFAPPSNNGGNAISLYTVTASPGGAIGSAAGSPIVVAGLTNGTSYSFTVRATNQIGTGTPSAPSNSVTPAASVAPVVSSISPARGASAGGTVVTINGSGFTAPASVRFGSAAASFVTINSATQIVATAPAGTGTVDVTVTTLGGTSATSAADQFTYANIAVSPVSTSVSYSSSANSMPLVITGAATSVSVATGALHGTATASGTTILYTPTPGYSGPDSFTYTASNATDTSAAATVSVNVGLPVGQTSATGSWRAVIGQPYSQTVTWAGGTEPYSGYTIMGLPAGLSVTATDTNSMTISGTPTQPGTFSINVSARDSSTGLGPFTFPSTFQLTVDGAVPLTLTPGAATLPATQGTAFSQVFAASGGTAPYTYTQTGTLPAGISWNAVAATLSGTPTESGTFAFSVTVVDNNIAVPLSKSQNYTLQVASQVPVAPTQSVSSGGPGEPVEVNLTASATGGPFTAANIVAVTPASAGSATISSVAAGGNLRQLRAASGNNYVLRFVPNPDASGLVTVTYTLSNAGSTSSPGVISISLTSRGDPSKDAEVQGVLNAQANSSRRFASGQISNFQQRLEALHAGNVSAFSNGFTLSSANLQRQRLRQNQNDDPTGIEQWMQIQSAKLTSDQALRSTTLNKQKQAQDLRPTSANAQGPELGNQSASAATSPLAFWTSGTISIGDDSSGSSAQSQDFVTSGLSVGADYRLAPNLTLGLGFGYGHDKTDIGNSGSRSQADSYSVALYGSYRPIKSIYLDAVLGYQQLTFDNRRYVTDNGSMVNGDRDGSQVFASLAAGYEYREESWLVSPYVRLDLAHAKLDSYRERGDNLFALQYEEQTVKTTSTSLGVRSEYAHSTSFGELTPSLRLEYQHDFQGTGEAGMRYSDSSTLYRVNLDALGQDRGVFGIGLGLLTESQWSLNMEYQYTISSGAQKAQTLLFGLRKPF